LNNLPTDSLLENVGSGNSAGYAPILTATKRFGIGNSEPHFILDVGITGIGTTALNVRNNAVFAGFTTTKDLQVTGVLTATNFDLQTSSVGKINAGVITATTLNVGTGVSIKTNSVGLGTLVPRADIDLEGSTRFKTYFESPGSVSSSSGVVTLDLAISQTFTLTVDEAITNFKVTNPPSGATAFTIKIEQDSTGYSVGIGTFKDNSGTSIPVLFPGGVVPEVTQVGLKSDIYSFMLFDGENITTSGLYGVIGGQNFA